MRFLRQHPLHSAVGVLVAVAVVLSLVFVGPVHGLNATLAATGYGYGYGYGTTPTVPIPPSTTTTTTAPTTTSAPTPPPKQPPPASTTFPNGALVTFSTTYVFAGGRAFATNATTLAAVQKVDPAKVLTAPSGATAPTSVAMRMGTLVTTKAVTGNPMVMVVGPGGDLHGFSTSAQFLKDGYDASMIVTIPSFSGLTMGSTMGQAGVNGLTTKSDRVIVNSSGTLYIFAGGRAFGIPTPAALQRVRRVARGQILTGSITAADTSAPIASGVLLSVSPIVYATYQGQVFPFRTMTQLKNLGYGGTAAVPTPNIRGLTIAR